MADATQSDPYLWLEEVEGAKALEFVKTQNARTEAALQGRAEFASIQGQVRQVLDSKERIPFVTQMGDRLYNFWRDGSHPRGLWRRTTWAEYRKPQPQWETVLDLDALARDEKENWVWSGANCLAPEYTRCVLHLSRGGGDAVVIREFDIPGKRFVADGFNLPEAKSDFTWRDIDTAYVGSDFGPGSMTDSGYPRLVKRWKRGTPLAQAPTVFEGQQTDVSVEAWVDHQPGYFREGFIRSIAFFNSESYVLNEGRAERIDVPNDAVPSLMRDWLVVRLRSAWTVGGQTYPQGALIATRAAAFAAGERKFQVLFTPSATASLQSWTPTRRAARKYLYRSPMPAAALERTPRLMPSVFATPERPCFAMRPRSCLRSSTLRTWRPFEPAVTGSKYPRSRSRRAACGWWRAPPPPNAR